MFKQTLKYKNAANLSEAFDYMEKGYLVFAGGTDVSIKVKEGILDPVGLLYIGDLPDFKGVIKEGDSVFVGSGEKVADLVENNIIKENFPGLVNAMDLIGSLQIRNSATLGGNLANTSPVADSIPMLLSLESTIHTVSSKGSRKIKAVDFATGVGKNVLENGELIKCIELPIIKNKNIQFFRKFGQRKEVSIAKCNIAAVLELEGNTVKNAAITLGAVAVKAIRCDKAEKMLIGNVLNKELVENVSIEVSEAAKPITDLRSKKEYRKEMVGVAFRDELIRLI